MMPVQRNDILWKGILEDFFEALLRFFFKDADQLFDFTKEFVFLDKEFEAISAGRELKHAKVLDKLVRVCTKSGGAKCVLVHLEVQGYADRDFANRMFTYYYRIRDKFHQPVTRIVIFGVDRQPVAVGQILDMYEKRGEGRGLQKGRQEGVQNGLREGQLKGLKEGRRSEALSIAKQLKELGVSIEIIPKSTGLSFSRIKAL